MNSAHARTAIQIAVGQGHHLSRCESRTLTWQDFYRLFETPPRGSETLTEFLKLSPGEQNQRKGAPGWIVTAPMSTKFRSGRTVQARKVLSFDIDNAPPALLSDLLEDLNPFCDFEFFLHTTRKHIRDAPRFRLFLLLGSACEPDRLEPVMRILGRSLDPSLNAVDPVSFRTTQLMYLPSLSKDSDWLLHHNPGQTVDPDDVLNGFEHDWRNFGTLPYSKDREQARRRAEKSANPLDKRGVIGAFCRTYSVPQAIAEFLPEIYEPGAAHGRQPRYTYLAGEGANGAVIYDDGLFLYSHHGTDPAGERNCNAFDLIRIHVHGHLDADKDLNDAKPTDWPSYKAMSEWCRSLPVIREELLAQRIDLAAMFDDLPEDDERRLEIDAEGERDLDTFDPAEIEHLFGTSVPYTEPWLKVYAARPRKPPKKWAKKYLDLSDNGEIRQNLPNLTKILMWDPRLFRVIARNGFNGLTVARHDVHWRSPILRTLRVQDALNGDPWVDVNDNALRMILEERAGKGKNGWGLRVPDRDLNAAVRLTADAWVFHPVQEYYESLTWDGTPRIDSFTQDYLGMGDTAYSRETARLFFIAAVARVYVPGHKWDHVPVISGPQGILKSTLVKTLFRSEWSGELTVDMASNKDSVEQMLGKRCLELPETSTMRMNEVERVKEFITIETDQVRLSYDRRQSRFPRQCVFVGTTNLSEFLKDPTGNRRFWPWPATRQRIELPDAHTRDQLWAEAYAAWRDLCRQHGTATHLPLYLTGQALTEAERLQDAALEENATLNTAALLTAWLDTPISLASLTDSRDGFDVDADVIQVLRVVTSPREAYSEALGIGVSDMAKHRLYDTLAGQALAFVEGWEKTEERVRDPRWGRVRQYRRSDATPAELKQGYRLVT